MDRYARQIAIGGWDQSALAAATVVIAGAGWTGFLCALMATALGFGRIVLVGRGTRVPDAVGLARIVAGSPKAWVDFLRRVNPVVKLVAGNRPLSRQLLERLPMVDVLVVAGTEVEALDVAVWAQQETPMRVVAGGAAGGIGFWGPPRSDGLTRSLAAQVESPVLAQVVAGLLVEEARKMILPLPDEAGPTHTRQLLVPHKLAEEEAPDRVAGRRPYRPGLCDISIVGAGALGTWFAMALGQINLRGRRVHLFDGDTVEETNLNRQVLFFGAVGRPKAPTLAGRLQRLFPRTDWAGYGMVVDRLSCPHVGDNDVLVACPDSFAVRAFLNDVARIRHQPLLNGGTSAWGGSCASYVPGNTPCLACLIDVDRLAQREAEPQPCAAQVEDSVVTSNAITGALMAWMLQEMMAGRLRRGVWEYDGRARDLRIGVHSVRPACECHLAA